VSRLRILLALPEYRVDRRMGGIGVRAVDLATALSSVACVTVLAAGQGDLLNVPFRIVGKEEANADALLTECDAVIFFDLGNISLLQRAVELDRFIVVENAPPLEHLEYNPGLPSADRAIAYKTYLDGFRLQMIAADHFLARSDIERTTLLACLAMAGRIAPADVTCSRTLDHLISRVPIGFARAYDRKLGPPDPHRDLLLWTGGLWDYMAPEAAVGPFASTCPVLGSRLEFGFLYPPARDQRLVAHGLVDAIARCHPRVWVSDSAPDHLEREERIASACALVSLGRPGIENETCLRLRIRDTLLYRRPVVVDPYGATAEYVRRTGVGVVAASLDAFDVADAMSALAVGGKVRSECLAAIEVERERCVLDDTLSPALRMWEGVNWRPLRSRQTKLAAMGAVSIGTGEVSGEWIRPFEV
jgi:hypothetical protein